MELINTSIIERIRQSLIKRYDRDQQIQQMIEEIGAEEGLTESELAIVYQAYLEVKERVYYTSALLDLLNQVEDVQKRMSLLHRYESLEQDLFGDVAESFDEVREDKGLSQNYDMEQVELQEVSPDREDSANRHPINLNELTTMGGLYHGKGETIQTIHDLDDMEESHIDVLPTDAVTGVESLTTRDVSDEEDHKETHADPFSMVNALLLGRDEVDRKKDKAQKKIEKILKKQLKRIDKEWAKLSGKDEKKDKKKKDKKKKDKKEKDKKEKAKKDKDSKNKDKRTDGTTDKKDKNDKKGKKDKIDKKDKTDKKEKKHKESQKEKK